MLVWCPGVPPGEDGQVPVLRRLHTAAGASWGRTQCCSDPRTAHTTPHTQPVPPPVSDKRVGRGGEAGAEQLCDKALQGPGDGGRAGGGLGTLVASGNMPGWVWVAVVVAAVVAGAAAELEFAVHVKEGGAEAADRVAAKHGMTNMGEVRPTNPITPKITKSNPWKTSVKPSAFIHLKKLGLKHQGQNYVSL